MDFELTKEQKEIQKAVRDFVKGEFKKDAIEDLVEKHEYPVAIWKKAADLGFIGIHFPEEYSGQGLHVMENILVAEGEVLSCGAFTEPDHGSDITRMDTVAVKDGNEWVINGANCRPTVSAYCEPLFRFGSGRG